MEENYKCHKCGKPEEEIDQPVEDLKGRIWCWECIEVEFFEALISAERKTYSVEDDDD